MNNNLQQIRDFVAHEITHSDHCHPWLWDEHLLIVEKIAEQLLTSHPEANREIVLLGVWLHDLGRAYGHDKDHDVWGADFSRKYLLEHGFSQEIVDGVYHVCLTHRVKQVKPETVEAKILSTADAMSHFEGGFYLRIFNSWSMKVLDYQALREKLVGKIERDYHQKIFFKAAKQAVQPMYESWKTALGKIDFNNHD